MSKLNIEFHWASWNLCLQYGIKKKVEAEEIGPDPGMQGRLGRKKKTQEEMAAENDPDAEDDDFTSKFSSLCCCMNFV